MAPPSLQQSLGVTFVGQSGSEVTLDDVIGGIEDGFIALYFAAEWAPNSSTITGQLIRLHQATKRDCRPPLRLVLVSSDEDESAFTRQVDAVPWPAIPFTQIRRRLRLLRQYRVTNLPFLALVNPKTGRCVSRVTRETLLRDPDCTRFPWRSKALREVLAKAEVVDPQGKALDFQTLKEGLKALYFSANWCPPCKAFTPQLVETYTKIQSKGHGFEVLFVSSDRSEESCRSYHAGMPWPGIAWREEDARRELAEALEVKGIPTLVLLDRDLSVISKDGRNLVNEDPHAEGFPWRPQSVELIKDYHMPIILERPTLILFTDGEPGEVQFGKDVLLPAAEEYLSEHPDEAGMSLKFFVAGEDDVSDGLRDLANLDDVVPLLTIIDLAEGVKYLLEKGVEISNATVHNFVTRYTNEDLSPVPIDQDERDTICEEDEDEEEGEEGEGGREGGGEGEEGEGGGEEEGGGGGGGGGGGEKEQGKEEGKEGKETEKTTKNPPQTSVQELTQEIGS